MIELQVCIGTSCHLKGSYNVLQTFRQLIERHSLHERVNLRTAFCTRQCETSGVAVSVNGSAFGIDAEDASAFFLANVLPLAGPDANK